MSSARLRLWAISAALVFCAVGASAWLSLSKAQEAPAAPSTGGDARRLEQLRAERRDVLQRVVDVLREQSAQGIVAPTELQGAVLALRQAELELCKTPAERIRVHEQIVESFRQQEQLHESLHRTGRSSAVQVGTAKADRLKAEIDLEEAKLSAASATKAKP